MANAGLTPPSRLPPAHSSLWALPRVHERPTLDPVGGGVRFQVPILALPGLPGLDLSLRYLSDRLQPQLGHPPGRHPLGPGWTTEWAATLTRDADGYCLDLLGQRYPFDDPHLRLEQAEGAIELAAAGLRLERRGDQLHVVRWHPARSGLRRYCFQPRQKLVPAPLLAIRDEADRELTCEIDRTGLLTAISSRGVPWRVAMTYTDAGLLHELRIENPGGDPLTLFRARYDSRDRFISWHDAAHRAFHYSYDDLDRLHQIAYANGPGWQLSYDERGRLTRIDVPELPCQLEADYHATGRLATLFGPANEALRVGYDESGRLQRLIFPDQRQLKLEFDRRGRLSRLEDGLHPAANFQYDALGHREQLQLGDGRLQLDVFEEGHRRVHRIDLTGGHWHWNYQGQTVQAMLGASAAGVQLSWDAFGRIQQLKTNAGRTLTFSRPERGQRLEIHTEQASYQVELDPLGRPGQIRRGEELTHSVRADPTGQVLELLVEEQLRHTFQAELPKQELRYRSPEGMEWRIKVRSDGRLESLVDPLRYRVQLERDAANRLTALTHHGGTRTTLVRSGGGNLAELHFADGRCEKLQYDVGGRCISQIRPDGSSIRFDYTESGFMSQRQCSMSWPQRYEYLPTGLLTRASSNGREVRLEWDGAARVTQEIVLHKRFRHHTKIHRDINHLITTISSTLEDTIARETFPSIRMSRDEMGRISEVVASIGDQSITLERVRVVPDARRLERRLGHHLIETRTVDRLGRLLHLRLERTVAPLATQKDTPLENGDAVGPRTLLLERRYTWSPGGRLRTLSDQRPHLSARAPAPPGGSSPPESTSMRATQGSMVDSPTVCWSSEYNSLGQPHRIEFQCLQTPRASAPAPSTVSGIPPLSGGAQGSEPSDLVREQRVYDAVGNLVRGPEGAATFAPGSRLRTYGDLEIEWSSLGAASRLAVAGQAIDLKFNPLYQLERVKPDDSDPLELVHDPLGRLCELRQGERLSRLIWLGAQPLAWLESEGSSPRRQVLWHFEAGVLRALWTGGRWYSVVSGHAGEILMVLSDDGEIVWEARYDFDGRCEACGGLFQPWRLPEQLRLLDLPLRITPSGLLDEQTGRWLTPHGSILEQARNPFVGLPQQALFTADRPDPLWHSSPSIASGLPEISRLFPSPAPDAAEISRRLLRSIPAEPLEQDLLPVSLRQALGELQTLSFLADIEGYVGELLEPPSAPLPFPLPQAAY